MVDQVRVDLAIHLVICTFQENDGEEALSGGLLCCYSGGSTHSGWAGYPVGIDEYVHAILFLLLCNHPLPTRPVCLSVTSPGEWGVRFLGLAWGYISLLGYYGPSTQCTVSHRVYFLASWYHIRVLTYSVLIWCLANHPVITFLHTGNCLTTNIWGQQLSCSCLGISPTRLPVILLLIGR